MLIFSSCKKNTETAETSKKEREIITYSSEASVISSEEETASAETTAQTEEESPFETTETENETIETTAEIPRDYTGMDVFFGHYMEQGIADVNRQTLSNEGSGLFDVLSDDISFTNGKVLSMIESYLLPEKAFYGEEEATQEVREAISDYRNLDVLRSKKLSDPAEISFGILSDNADVRSFPTALRATDTGALEEFDYFQESVLSFASGVIVLHRTADGVYSFVQGTNYFGWILSENIALCGREEFVSYLTEEYFLVNITPDYPVDNVHIRLGTVIPYTGHSNDEYMLLWPFRNAEGLLKLEEIPIQDDGSFSDGFLKQDKDTLLSVARGLLGTPYGWGDSDGYYDCSSTVGLLYQCFGLYMPRNTSLMRTFGGTVLDVSLLSDDEKLRLLSGKEGAIILMPGHAMLYEGEQTGDDGVVFHTVIHNTSAFYEDASLSEISPYYRVTKSVLEKMYKANGERFLSRITLIILFDNNNAETAE